MSHNPNTTDGHAPIAEQPSHGCTGETGSTTDILKTRLMGAAQKRTLRRAVSGARFCAVMLDDGGVGVANLCPEVCGSPSSNVSCSLPEPGTPAVDVLASLSSLERSALGLATANALTNRFTGGVDGPQRDSTWQEMGQWRQVSVGRDVLDVVELHPDDHVGMVGCFSPIVEPIRRRVRRMSIFERGPRLTGDLLSEERAAELLPRCSVALITATALINGTIDRLFAAARGCREVILLGPSTPLFPEAFASAPAYVTLLAGVVVTRAAELLDTVAQGGGTRDFKGSVVKVNVRTGAFGRNSNAI